MIATLSVVIACRNSEDRICNTIRPWKKIANEIIVVDQKSSDKTVVLAESEGAMVFVNDPQEGNFDLNRKFAIQKAKSEWVLYIDTDERPTEDLLDEIKHFLSNTELNSTVNGVKIPNLFYFLGKALKHGLYNSNSSEVRMFRKGKWTYTPEDGFHRGVSVEGDVHKFKNPYKHFNVNALSEWFIKTNQYTEHDSIFLSNKSDFPEKKYMLFWRAWMFFLRHYFFKLGFLDGFHGMVSIYYFMNYHLTLGIKVWEKKFLKNMKEEEDYLKPFQIPYR